MIKVENERTSGTSLSNDVVNSTQVNDYFQKPVGASWEWNIATESSHKNDKVSGDDKKYLQAVKVSTNIANNDCMWIKQYEDSFEMNMSTELSATKRL